MAQRPKIACVLRSGGEYTADHVAWLQRQVLAVEPETQFICLSDEHVPCTRVPLTFGYPGWWSKLELCRPDIEGDVLFFDLDTVIVGKIDKLLKVGHTTFLRDFYRHGDALQSSVMYLTERDRRWAWERWQHGPSSWMRELGHRGDQAFFEEVLRDCHRWQDVLPGKLISFKVDIRASQRVAPPAGTSVVVFHGKPRPWNVNAHWIPSGEFACPTSV